MRKYVFLIIALALSLGLCACGNNSKDRIQIDRVQNAKDLFLQVAETTFVYDDLYLTEHAEIHHNAWTIAYEKAMDAYNALSAEEKEFLDKDTVSGRHSPRVDLYEDNYNEICIEQEIALYCKDTAVEELKDSLINKSSYEEYDWILEYSHYSADDNTFLVELEIEYSATNRMGGRIDDTEYVSFRGTYQDGEILITSY